MLVKEILENGLERTYSDTNKMIRQIETDVVYEEAVDIPNKYTYEEIDIEIVSTTPPDVDI